jgi:cytidylate kinase
MIIAIDGPCASGKGPLARRLANRFGIRYLETGALYRVVAYRVLLARGDPLDVKRASTIAHEIDGVDLTDPNLLDEEVGLAASKVATLPEVRHALIDFQRSFAATPPGAVLDGRDIGTIILPHAPFKFFLTGSLERRVQRRFQELLTRNASVTLEKVRVDMEERDRRDQGRSSAPLQRAPDAILLDTSCLTDDDVMIAATEYIVHRARDLRIPLPQSHY